MLYLIDSGTLDTEFVCTDCGETIVLSPEGIERDEDGTIPQHEEDRIREEHEAECEPRD